MNYGFTGGPLDPIEDNKNERTAHVDPSVANGINFPALGETIWHGVKDVAHVLNTPFHQIQEVMKGRNSNDPVTQQRASDAYLQLMGEGGASIYTRNKLKNNKKKVRCTYCGQKQPKSELQALPSGDILCRDERSCQSRADKNFRKFHGQ